MSGCTTCHASGHDADGHIEEAFTNPTTREPYNVPADIKKAVTRIVSAYGIRGICDPMYIANIIARETGRGDGESHFYTEVLK